MYSVGSVLRLKSKNLFEALFSWLSIGLKYVILHSYKEIYKDMLVGPWSKEPKLIHNMTCPKRA